MLTVVWNPIGSYVLKALPKGRKFNAQYYTNDTLVVISDWRRQTGGTRPNKLWVHSDNVRPHIAKMSRDDIGLNQMKQVPHPPYSPDLASSDFFLFGYVKGKLMGYHAETPIELLDCIRVILAEIPRETLNAVFLEWMDGATAKMRTGRW
jgi:histone-lysine N-methyltransferase SETMAR